MREGAKKIRQTLQTIERSTYCGATNKYAGLKKCNVETIILNNILNINLLI